MIRCIIFDLGDVVLDVHFDLAIARLMDNTGLSGKEINKRLFDSGIKDAHDRGELSAEEFFQKISESLKLDMNMEEFKQAWADIFSENKEVTELLPGLKRHYKLALLSNTDDIHFSFAKRRFRIMDIFEDCFLSYKLKSIKPEPGIFREALKKLRLKPSECAFIDNMKENVDAAAKEGINAIQYQKGRLAEELGRLGVAHG